MKTRYDAKVIKEQMSLVSLLAAIGFEPVKRSGNELLFLSPLRETDTKPSFSVNEKLGCWYDHGLGKGGNIIDFGIRYWPNHSFQEVLEKIVDTAQTPFDNVTDVDSGKRKRLAVKIPNYLILDVKDLGANYAISQYLQSRGVWDAAQGVLKEIYYYVEDEQKNRKHFFAAGCQNELGAWEVRNLYFKGCIGHKAITFIPGDHKNLCVFEGFMNYLSWLSDDPFCGHSVLILNSLSLLQSGISKARGFDNISTYFDNDPSGIAATETFRLSLPQTNDCSWIYEGYNDYNEKLVADVKGFQFNRQM